MTTTRVMNVDGFNNQTNLTKVNTLIIDDRASFLASFFASFLSSSSVKFSRKEGTKSCRDENISSTNKTQQAGQNFIS